ncbi:MAG: hypothetical protein APZ16_06020 [Candidatus Hadarchaeum yellowstonense]|uniref:DUF7343 domain-containing protein n=1 Tax=Hadarchaeum yellowstonense TaxID=1776334 RepID=A0A147JVD2_HADYE|nr:MAG: hypothetical protein APZ16_06020 [Candidatus Hadarchaeum yellowstonense]
MSRRSYFFALAAVLLFSLCLQAAAQENFARVRGTVYYWYNLEPLKNSIVTVNSTPEQTYVARDGEYSFSLPPGTYTITARYYRDNVLLYFAEENLVIPEIGGDYVVDLIAFPLFEDTEMPEENALIPPLETYESENVWLVSAAVASLILVLALAVVYYLRSRRKRMPEPAPARPAQEPVKYVGLPEDLQDIIDRVRGAGGRITQLELRKSLPYSEAKVSLMLADLESRGLIRRIKKGRGNIIILKE